MSGEVKAILGAFCVLVGGGILLVWSAFGALEGSSKNLLLWQFVGLASALVASGFAWSRSVKQRDFFHGILIGVGILALLWGICSTAFAH